MLVFLVRIVHVLVLVILFLLLPWSSSSSLSPVTRDCSCYYNFNYSVHVDMRCIYVVATHGQERHAPYASATRSAAPQVPRGAHAATLTLCCCAAVLLCFDVVGMKTCGEREIAALDLSSHRIHPIQAPKRPSVACLDRKQPARVITPRALQLAHSKRAAKQAHAGRAAVSGSRSEYWPRAPAVASIMTSTVSDMHMNHRIETPVPL